MQNEYIFAQEQKFTKALAALERIAYLPMQIDNMNIEAVTHRFEFTSELFLPWMQSLLKYQKIEAKTPREVISESYIAGYIDDEKNGYIY